MNISAWVLGWRNLWRDWRAGELRLLMVAVTLAVAALTAVGFFSDRLQSGLERDARQLLGGDAVVVSDHPPAAAWTEQAGRLGLQSALTLGFPTMGRAPDAQGGAVRLVALKAVQPGYPLRGQLRLARDADDLVGEPISAIPAPGQAWVDPALLEALGLHVGDTLLLGDSALRIDRLIALEPDRGVNFMSFAPRVLMNAADLPATGLVQPASRITWRLAVAGEDQAVRRFQDWAEQQAHRPGVRGVRLESLDTGRPEMRATLDRAQKFLNLVALLSALLAAVAVALAARGFAARHLDDCAMLRVLGLPQRRIAGAYAVEFALAGLAASVAGGLAGYALHHVFVALLREMTKAATALPAPGVWPLLWGLGIGLTLLAAFGLPPVLQLARVPALRVIRRDVGALKPVSMAVLALGVAGFAALLLAVSADLTLGLIAVGGFAGAVALFALLAWGAVALLRRVVSESAAPRWLLLAARQIAARPAYAVLQVSSLAVGLLALVLLALLRTDLIASWRAATPADAPNRFVINVMPDQGAAFRAALQRAGVTRLDWYPMFRGRLVAINGRDITPADFAAKRAQQLVEREFNLSYAAQAPTYDDISAGRWQEGERDAISVEQGLADTLGLKLGDALRFDIAGTPIEAHIRSLRKVDWASMHVNFFVMFPLAEMADMPITYIAAYHAPRQPGFDSALVRQFPNITSIDMEQSIAQMQRVLEQVIGAVQFLFGFTLAAGLIVLAAAVGATREERVRDFAIMRALGAGSGLLAQVQRAELIGTGLLAGLLASAVAMVVGWAMTHYVFDFSWNASPLTPLAGAIAGAALALAAGWHSLREVLRRPVVEVLRRSSG
ncbi:MAG: ABC transporter permease [Burkholderiaceae bacterium]|jgi:putative ABC transport system permease protein|nr:ABC transporter permease [Burkholderiaceae bacterium]